MNNQSSFLKDISKVAGSRLISLLGSVATGLLVPKLLSVNGYGLLKIYTLYVVYTALLHFGFPDGILLKYAGTSFDDLSAKRMRTFTAFYMLFQLGIGAVLSSASIFVRNPDYAFIVLMLGINLVIINVTTYYQFLSQATQRFSEYSGRYVLVSVLKIVFIGILFLAKHIFAVEPSYRLYIVGLNIIDGLLLIWYFYTYREITFGQRDSFSDGREEIRSLFQTGIILTIAYQIGHLVFALDRQFVSLLFPTEVFAHYSFAYTMINMVSTMIASISIVLLPMLKKTGQEYVNRHYAQILAVIASLAGASLAGYYPLNAFIQWFLPQYARSVVYLRIVMPALVLTCCISVVMFTCFKALDLTRTYLRCGCVALLIGTVTNAGAYLLFHSPEAISYASLLTMFLWFLICNHRLRGYVTVNTGRIISYIALLILGFYLISAWIPSLWLCMVAYIGVYLGLLWLFFGRDIAAWIRSRR